MTLQTQLAVHTSHQIISVIYAQESVRISHQIIFYNLHTKCIYSYVWCLVRVCTSILYILRIALDDHARYFFVVHVFMCMCAHEHDFFWRAHVMCANV